MQMWQGLADYLSIIKGGRDSKKKGWDALDRIVLSDVEMF